ncbi:MAG: hypothetical protein GTO46_04800 [Gemmatimonadetes bacterium]|nr:hypothetical protein [Gemmatimonadota bacterium]NIO31024.1 hypothetical protein [Gemmatimonadota bacterium]
MVHLSNETLSELLDGSPAPGVQEHLASCSVCQGELEVLRRMRTQLRDLPQLDPPPDLWSRIEERLPYGDEQRRLGRLGRVALRVAAMAAVFVIGLALGQAFQLGESGDEVARPVAGVPPTVVDASEAASPASLADAMAEVRRLASEYDAALMNLQRMTQGRSAPGTSSLARQRLANLEALVEASRAALATDPADPVLNAYLFTAVAERDAMMSQLSSARGSGSGVVWR